MRYRIARPTDLLVPVALSSTPAADDHPVAELRNHKPWRTFRTQSASGTQSITWDRGASGPLDSMFIGNANFPQFDLTAGADGITFGTTLVSNGTITLNRRIKRRNKWLSIGGTQPRYVKLTMEGTPDDGATQFQLGQWTLHSGSLLLGDYSNEQLEWTPWWPSTHIPMGGGAEEVTDDGPVYLETVIQNPNYLRGSAQTIQNELLDLLHAAGAGGHFVIYEETLGVDSQAFIVQRKDPDFPVAERVSTFAAGIRLREVA